MHKKVESKDECVQVMVRCRPMNKKETANGSKKCVEVDKSVNQVILKQVEEKMADAGRVFTYDAVFGIDST